jgi:hypothetical protein
MPDNTAVRYEIEDERARYDADPTDDSDGTRTIIADVPTPTKPKRGGGRKTGSTSRVKDTTPLATEGFAIFKPKGKMQEVKRDSSEFNKALVDSIENPEIRVVHFTTVKAKLGYEIDGPPDIS